MNGSKKMIFADKAKIEIRDEIEKRLQKDSFADEAK